LKNVWNLLGKENEIECKTNCKEDKNKMKDKMKLGIECVCTANGGRSPMAEVTGKAHVADLGLDGRVDVLSSGSHYQVLQTMDMPFDYLMSNLEMGYDRGLYSGGSREQVKQMLGDRENLELKFGHDKMTQVAVKTLAKVTEDFLTEEEEHFRDLVLDEVGLSYNGQPQQYDPREDVQLVLPMKGSNADRVREVKAKINPKLPQVIVPIREYAGLPGDIPNPFGKGIEVWRETRDSIMEATKASIDKAIGEYL